MPKPEPVLSPSIIPTRIFIAGTCLLALAVFRAVTLFWP